MSRQKVVFPTGEIPHLWVHQKGNEARNPQGNLYFNGDTIYSYGSHFPIARLVKFKDREAVLFTTRGYSCVTAGHKHVVLNACQHLTVFKVNSVKGRHSEAKASYKERCDELLHEARKIRQGSGMSYKLGAVTEIIEEANRYAGFFGLKWEFKYPDDWAELLQRAHTLRERYEVLHAERLRVKAEKRAKEEELSRKKFEEILPVWENGDCVTNVLPRTGVIYLRVAKGGRRVETSWGARVPMAFAKAVWELIKTARGQNEAIVDISLEKLDDTTTRSYPINRIDADGAVHAGCHHIAWPQIERLAKHLNWLQNDTEGTNAAPTA